MRLTPTLAIVLAVVVLGPMLSISASPHASPLRPDRSSTPVPTSSTPTSPASAGPDLPSWPTYLANPERTSANQWERTLAASNVSQLQKRWSYATGGSVFASAAVVNGSVYVGSWDGYEYALNSSTGALDWKTNLGLSSSCYVGGIDSSATVWNGTVYVGGGNDHWYALNAANGSVEWSLNVLHYGSTTGNFDWISPLLYHGYEYIGLASCSDSPLVQGKLLEVNLTGNHSVVREFDAAPNGTIGVTLWETPSVDPVTNTIWLATGNEGHSGQPYAESMVALNATTLAVLGHWEVPGVIGQDDDFGSGPTLFNDSSGRPLAIAVNKDGTDYAFNRSNVTTNGSWGPAWTIDAGTTYTPSAFDGSRLFLGGGSFTDAHHVSSSASVYEVDPGTGQPVWHVGLGNAGTIIGGLAYANGLLFVPDGPDLDVLNASDGTLLTTWVVPGSGGAIIDGTPTVLDGEVVVGAGNFGSSGSVYALEIPLTDSILVEPANTTPSGELQFHAQTTGGSPSFNFSWTFGDGTSGFGPAPSHLYEFPGPYTVNLSVRDGTGTVANATAAVTVLSSPTPLSSSLAGSPATGVAPLLVNFTGGETAGTPPVSFELNFGDGSVPMEVENASHWYNISGTYHATLVVVDGWGRSSSANLTVEVIAPLALVASASPTSGVVPLNVTFVDAPSGGTAPYKVEWNFGDGSPVSNEPEVVHEYGAGTFLVHDTVTDLVGLQANRTFTIVVTSSTENPPPAPLSSVTTVSVVGVNCSTNTTEVETTSVASGGVGPYTYSWTFGDGSGPVPGANVSHAYRVPGGYGVLLNVTDSEGVSLLNLSAVTIPTTGCPATIAPTPSSATPNLVPLIVGAVVGVVLALVVVVLWARRRPPRRGA